ncbi:PEGA domain-containing protein [Pelagicoccus sp. NFK12]|uniref:PEGA domain-containing protein n=1 Tax=Pelagicoccus enzymogenes TaxID=2773457 RepID=A0A927IF64_9BACT|nr:PEGA domain-containing protein [Pelagicoccus enzymogenes]MBD5779787.1 PEGA domain-containing protein [Pelagicoccus enzymogenes]
MKKLIRFVLLLLLPVSVFGRDVLIDTVPRGARIEIINLGSTRIRAGAVYTGPAEIDFSRRSELYQLEVSAPGYQTELVTYDYNAGSSIKSISVSLEKLTDTKTFQFSSEPSGAAVTIDGKAVGVTPLSVNLDFNREDKDSPWSTARATISLRNHETKSVNLSVESTSSIPLARLALLKDRGTFTIKTTSGGRPLPGVPLTVDGNVVGETPLQTTFDFERSAGTQPWSVIVAELGIPEEFISKSINITRDGEKAISVDLDPVTEVPVTLNFPTTSFTVRGPQLSLDTTQRLGMLNSRDLSTPYSDLRKVTNFTRSSPILTAVNSFALTPDGQSIIYAVTMENEDGSNYSNLFMKAANDQSFSFLQITRGNQYFDTNPSTGVDPSSNLVVFQSNRLGRRNSWDISAVRVQDGRVVGGVLQLTHEPRFNFRPTIVSENRPAFFIGYDDFPSAEPYISSIRLDGSSYTVLGEVAEEVVYTQSGKLFLVRSAADTGIKQIYSVTTEGLVFSTVINDFEFSQAHCFNPAISPDESKMIFVSDYARDMQDRQNNNLFILDFESGRIQQITDNGSDDIAPLWSPTDPNVVFFLSNREGIYNIWRMELVVGN